MTLGTAERLKEVVKESFELDTAENVLSRVADEIKYTVRERDRFNLVAKFARELLGPSYRVEFIAAEDGE